MYYLFDIFRYLVFVFVTIYCVVTTAQSVWGYYLWLSQKDRYTDLLRNYIFVQAMRLRFRSFAGDLAICGMLCVVFLLLWRAHNQVAVIARTLSTLK